MSTFIQLQNQLANERDDDNKKRSKLWIIKYILCKTVVVGWIFVFLCALFVAYLTYHLLVNLETNEPDTFTCFVNTTFRVPCGKVNITESDCVHLACCYDKPTKSCYHYLPSKYSYDLTGSSYRVSRSLSPFNTRTVQEMEISVNEISSTKISIYLHKPGTNMPKNIVTARDYVVKQAKEKLMVEIFRSNGDRILSTAKGPLIVSENYWEWTVYLTDHSLFGIGGTLIQRHKNSTITRVFYKNQNDHSSIPVIWAYKTGKFHSLSIKCDGPLEVSILTSNLVILKSLVGETIELVLYTGPTPSDLHKQHLEDIEAQEVPDWVLKTHMCRKNAHFLNVSTLVSQFVLDSEADSFCIDENLLMGIVAESVNGTNYTNEVVSLISPFREVGKKFLLSVPPQVLMNSSFYEEANNYDLLYRYLNQTIYQGKYLQQTVSYIDYSHENIQEYIETFLNFLDDYFQGVIDGFVLTDNWPVDEDFKMDNVSFPYFTKSLQEAMSYTIQWNTTANNISHIQKHNAYGNYQYQAIKNYLQLNNKDLLIMSATQSIGQVEPMIIENVNASWTNLRKYLDGVLFDSIIGNHLVSIPICGDTSVFDTSVQMKLCLRWYLIAASMPMLRISTPQPWRNPDNITSQYDQQIAKSAIKTRNMLLPYYNWFISNNEPVVRPMFYDFYENTTTFLLEEQYMVGDSMLVAQALTAERTKMNVYLPPVIDVWYELWGGGIYKSNKTHPWASISITEADFLAFIPKGSIIPLKDGNIVNLIVALNFTSTKNKTPDLILSSAFAKGSMKVEENSITFEANLTSVNVISSSDNKWNFTLGYVKLYKYFDNNNTIRYDINFPFDQDTQYIPYEPPPTTTTESTTTSTTTTASSTSSTTESTITSTSTTSNASTMESTTIPSSSTTSSTTDNNTPTAESTTISSSGTTSSTTDNNTPTTESTIISSSGTTSSTTDNNTPTTESTTISSSGTTSSTTDNNTPTSESTTISSSSSTTSSTTDNTTPTTESTNISSSGTTSSTTENNTPTTENTTISSSSTTSSTTKNNTPTTESTTISSHGTTSSTTDNNTPTM